MVSFLYWTLLIGTAILFIFWGDLILTYFFLPVFLLYLLLEGWVTFRVPDKSADDLLDWDPRELPASPPQVAQHVKDAGLLGEGETILAGLDETLLGNGSRGSVLTSERFFSYDGSRIIFETPIREIQKITFRRNCFPRVPFIGRLGGGLLRGTIQISPNKIHSFRWSGRKPDLDPLVRAMLARLEDRVVTLRTRPGI